jgi:dTDP-glucose 4,6-dehydratase
LNILITGAKGFVGYHLVKEIVRKTDWNVISLERLPHGKDRLEGIPRITRFYHDFRAPLSSDLIAALGKIHIIIHNGAEVHAIRSLTDPQSFVQSNVVGVFNMLEAARKLHVQKFIYTSSAEVFGAAKENESHSEDVALNPSNPYSAAKAGGEMLVKSYVKSFGIPAVIVRSMNMFGEFQDNTKFVPMAIKKILLNEVLKIHVGEKPGSRQWIHIDDYVNALLFLLTHGEIGESYNVAGTTKNNFEISAAIGDCLGRDPRIESIQAPPSHDLRYSISDVKLRTMGWQARIPFDGGLARTVKWYEKNQGWL